MREPRASYICNFDTNSSALSNYMGLILDESGMRSGGWLGSTPNSPVEESWRNQGIASLLVDRCDAEARKAGVGKIYLSTEFASGLYEKLGWEFFERCVYKGIELDVMCKEFTS